MADQLNKKTLRRGIEWTGRTVGVFGGCVHDCRWLMPDGTWAICYAKNLAHGERWLTGKQLRLFNEVPGIASAIIVILVVAKPF